MKREKCTKRKHCSFLHYICYCIRIVYHIYEPFSMDIAYLMSFQCVFLSFGNLSVCIACSSHEQNLKCNVSRSFVIVYGRPTAHFGSKDSTIPFHRTRQLIINLLLPLILKRFANDLNPYL